jgi:replicative DNA helicase
MSDEYDGPDDGPRMPEAAEAEQATLGGMLLSVEAIADCMLNVRAHDFYLPKHAVTFEAITALYGAGKPADVVTVADELERRGEIGRVGGFGYLYTLTSLVPAPALAGHYASIVAETAVKRRLVEAGTRIAAMGRGVDGTPADLLGKALAEVDAAGAGQASSLRSVGDAFDAFAASLDEDQGHFVPTPWYELNRIIDGWRPGALYVVGARPGKGKSVFGLNAARWLAPHGPVGFVSMEMEMPEILVRLTAQMADIEQSILGRGRSAMTDSVWRRVSSVRAAVQDMPLMIDDSPEQTLASVQAYARSIHRLGGMQALVVDYMQLMDLGRKTESRQQEVSEISRGLKQLAKQLQIPVIALAQVNRPQNGQQPRRQPTPKPGQAAPKPSWGGPEVAHLRESGAIEQNADVVILLHRDGPGDDLHVKVGKNRHGREGQFSLAWEGQFARAVSHVRRADSVPLDGVETDHGE